MINFKLDNLLLKMLKGGKNVSDLNLSCGKPPQIEIDSHLLFDKTSMFLIEESR